MLKEIIITDENQELSLRCLSKDKSFYKVKLENNELGFIPLDERGVKFQTWEEHILSLFAIGFKESINPLRDKPSDESDKIYYDPDEFYHPNQIKGEWLQVKWGTEGDWEYGWVKWKENGKLLINFFYFA